MRIVIDIQGAQTESRFRGIGRYSISLAKAMIRNAGSHEVWVAMNATMSSSVDYVRESFADLLPAHRLVSFHALPDVSWEAPDNAWRRGAAERAREAFLANLNPDIVHVSSLFEGAQDGAVISVGELDAPVPSAVTLYDLIPLASPEEYLGADWTHGWYMSKVNSLRRADLLLGISEHARSEAIGLLGLDPSHVINISSAVSSEFQPRELSLEDKMALARRFGISKRFVMYSGAPDPRKNVDGLIEAFGAMPRSLLDEYQLVIAGKFSTPQRERLEALARSAGFGDRLVVTGYITDQELISLYRAASLYVFPSFHEGFGLPPLEAMACGTPTIGSSTTSIPEVIGRADALFDPRKPLEIASVMARALSDADFNASLREHAPRQAAKFSWDTSAIRAIEGFEEAHARRLPRQASWLIDRAAIEASSQRLVSSIAGMPAVTAPARGVRIMTARMIAENEEAALHAMRAEYSLGDRLAWRVEGPFDSSYSLALVNRELALALSEGGCDVALHSTEGPGDFPASPAFLAANPAVAALHAQEARLSQDEADVSSRLLYPPRVADMRSKYNLLHSYAWEESGFPFEWIHSFNESLQGVSTLSAHVSKILVDNGIDLPLAVGGAGVDHWERLLPDNSYKCAGRGFRFLHVSSCFPRKGADVLLKAYGDAFTAADDVSLVIKTFENPHNEIRRWIDEARQGRDDFPHVELIVADLTDSQLKALYMQCHALVAPSRAEGFGLPLAEAMLSGLPVITTNWGGQLDFCNPDTAWLIDFDFAPAKTHFELFNSAWAEPRRDHLATLMREVRDASPEVRASKVGGARNLLLRDFTWANVARRSMDFVRRLAASPHSMPPRVGWVSTWNKPCGIASYSAYLVNQMAVPVTILAARFDSPTAPDTTDVVRCWNSEGFEDFTQLREVVDRSSLDAIVIQFQYGFFEFGPLADFILAQKRAGRTVVVMIHSTQDSENLPQRRLEMLSAAFAECDRILVHNVNDMNRLKTLGLSANVALIPHGVIELPGASLAPGRQGGSGKRGPFRVASYGFCLPHKGLPQLVEAVGLLVNQGHDVELTMVNALFPAGHSKSTLEEIEAAISAAGIRKRVTLVTDYLQDEESYSLLKDQDLLVFPYQVTGESSSAAVRFGLATGVPLAVTPISIFDDVESVTYRLPGVTPESIAEGIAKAIREPESVAASAASAARWRVAHSYSRVGQIMKGMISSLVRERAGMA